MKKPQIFLFHFAGGNCYSFQQMVRFLAEFDVVSLELPGRGKRVKEDLLKVFDQAAQDLYQQVKKKLISSNFMIYGHSMGAHLALKVTNMLEKENKFPCCLIVSGNPGPGVLPDKERYSLSQDDFIEELKKLGGFPLELLQNKESLDFFLPILRADFEIAENSSLDTKCSVKAPIFALMGDLEEKTSEISNWKRFTEGNFDYQLLNGGHFFINDYPDKVANIIKELYDETVLLRYQQNSL